MRPSRISTRFGYFIRGDSGPDPTVKLTLDAWRRVMHQRHGFPSMGVLFYDLSGDPVPDSTVLVEVRATTMASIGPSVVTLPETAVSARVVFVLPNDAVLCADDVCLAW